MKDFFKRPYWKRTWIIQVLELAEGDTWVYCRVDVVWYRRLYTMVQLMLGEVSSMMCSDTSLKHCRCKDDLCEYKLLESVVAGVSGIRKPTPKGLNRKRPETLIELMYKYVSNSCEDPRDKIFALFAIQRDIPNTSHLLDYSHDVQYLFLFLLTMYSNARRFLPRSETQWMIDGQFEALTGLVERGRMLLHSL